MKRDIKTLKEKEVIHCPTFEDFSAVVKLNRGGIPLGHWNHHKAKTYYRPYWDSFGSLQFANSKKYTIYPASDFLETEFKYGDIVEVRDNENQKWFERVFIGINPLDKDYQFVAGSKSGVQGWKFCRHANTEKTAIEKEIQEKEAELEKLKAELKEMSTK